MSFDEEIENFVKGKKPSYNVKEKKFIKQEYSKTGLFEGQQYEFEIMSREEWGASKALYIEPFSGLVADVVVGYTNTEECHELYDCMGLVNSLQKKHMDEGQPDIRHNFLVAGDGQIYEGRGWHVKPPPGPEWTEAADCSINIAYIGMKGHFPPKPLAKIAMQLIDFGTNNQCLQKYVGVYFDYFDDHHDVMAEMEKNKDYTDDGPEESDDETIYLQH